MAKHKQRDVKIVGESVPVDEGIASLVLALNSLGYRTLGSCEGGRNLTYCLFSLNDMDSPYQKLQELAKVIHALEGKEERYRNIKWMLKIFYSEEWGMAGHISLRAWISHKDAVLDKEIRTLKIESLCDALLDGEEGGHSLCLPPSLWN